jgi:hypothetical protein
MSMMRRKPVYAVLILLETFLLSSPLLWAAEGIISKVPDASGKYCHLKFPAIREETLVGGRPVLKDPSDGDIIDFYGPCDHDPLGREEILRQRLDWQRQQRRESGND